MGRLASLGGPKGLTFAEICSILKIVQAFFAARGGEGKPPKLERLRRKPKNCQRTF